MAVTRLKWLIPNPIVRMRAQMSDEHLAEIEARADDGCDGHGRVGAELPDVLFCPCVEQTAVDVRVLLAEVRRLQREVNLLSLSRGIPSTVRQP